MSVFFGDDSGRHGHGNKTKDQLYVLLRFSEHCLMLQQNGGYNFFLNGGFSLQDDLRSGPHMEIDVAELKHAIESESDQSYRNIAQAWTWIHYQFKKLGLVQ